MVLIVGLVDVSSMDYEVLWRRPYSIPQAAEKLCVPVRTLHSWVSSGQIMARQIGKKWEIPRVVVELMREKTMAVEAN